MIELSTVAEVVRILGGTTEVAKLTGRKLTAASNWNSFENFPPNTYVVMTEALAHRGYRAPASLWKMVEPSPEKETT